MQLRCGGDTRKAARQDSQSLGKPKDRHLSISCFGQAQRNPEPGLFQAERHGQKIVSPNSWRSSGLRLLAILCMAFFALHVAPNEAMGNKPFRRYFPVGCRNTPQPSRQPLDPGGSCSKTERIVGLERTGCNPGFQLGHHQKPVSKEQPQNPMAMSQHAARVDSSKKSFW